MHADLLMSLDEARERMLSGVGPLPVEQVPLADALGRVLAFDLAARLTAPPWDNSAMDGFAVRSVDVAVASMAQPATLRVIGEVAAGHVPARGVEEGTAIRLLTGGIVPPGADAVVPVEDTDAPVGMSTLPERVRIRAPAAAGQHIRRQGSDMAAGDPILAAGMRLSPAAIAALAAGGHSSAPVHRRPLVAVLSTGDELVPVGQPTGPASIPDSNSEALAAQAQAAGADMLRLGIARDVLADVRDRLARGVAEADIIVCSGGVSVGAHDVVKEAFAEVGSLILWRVAVQPGKPLAFGRATRPGGSPALLFGLPGNPVSSFVTFELFVRPVIRRLRGERDLVGRPVVHARLLGTITKAPGRRAFLRVRLEPDLGHSSGYRAQLSGGQGSHVLSALAFANGLAIVPEDITRLEEGSVVEVMRLDMEVV